MSFVIFFDFIDSVVADASQSFHSLGRLWSYKSPERVILLESLAAPTHGDVDYGVAERMASNNVTAAVTTTHKDPAAAASTVAALTACLGPLV